MIFSSESIGKRFAESWPVGKGPREGLTSRQMIGCVGQGAFDDR
jgi:hypothetical protein